MAEQETINPQGSKPNSPPINRPLLILIDGHALVHRAWNAIRVRQQLTIGRTGEDVTAVYGFTNTFLKMINDWDPTYCAVAWDLPSPTFRHLMYEKYKAHRPETAPELKPQFDRVLQVLEAFNVPVYYSEGFEADDVLGTLCHQAEARSIDTLIFTGDTDTFQLVSPLVKVALQHSVQDKKVYGVEEIVERYQGLTPLQQPDLKALKGDPSDNIPGVPGIGDKIATRLILQFGNLEGLYANLEQVEPPKIRDTLTKHQEDAFKGKHLTTIVRNVPVNLELSDCKFGNYDRQWIVDLLRNFEFTSLAYRVPASKLHQTPFNSTNLEKNSNRISRTVQETEYKIVDTEHKLNAMITALNGSGGFSFDTETTDKDQMKAKLVGLSFSIGEGSAWYIPVGHNNGAQIPIDTVLTRLKPLLESPEISKTAHNSNYDISVLENHSIRVCGVDFDTMVAAHMLGMRTISLKGLALEMLNIEMTPIRDLIGSGSKQITMDAVPIPETAEYACADADMTGRLRTLLETELIKQNMLGSFSSVEMPLVPILVSMQKHGIRLDTNSLIEMSTGLNADLEKLETSIYAKIGHTINLNSPQQLSNLLFGDLGLPRTKKTKTGYTTDASALESMRGLHPVVEEIIEYRQLSKIKSTYVDALPQLVNNNTGRLHTKYNQTGSATGRISSSDPNLQNIPVRSSLGAKVRSAFVAQNPPDWLLFSADYSQIELRVLAHLSGDKGLSDAFNLGEDIHSSTASSMYDVQITEVTSDMRRIAKVLNFGVIYGLSAFGISQQTEFSPEEGQKFITTYFGKYPGIRKYIDSVKDQARRDGYVATMLGRRRYVPDINASNHIVRQAAERVTVNMPIQGGASDIVKVAMIAMHQRISEKSMKTRMLLQVHDEIIFEVPVTEADSLEAIVLEEMPQAMTLDVPLKVDVKRGYTWSEMK